MSSGKREQAKISDYYSPKEMGRSGGYRQRVRQRKSREFPNVITPTERHANVPDSCNTASRPTKVYDARLPTKHGSSPERPQVSPASMSLPSPPFPPPSPPSPQAALASSSVTLSSSSCVPLAPSPVQPPPSFSYQAPPPSSAEGNQPSPPSEQRDSSHVEQGLGSASTNSPSLFQRLGALHWRCFLVAVLFYIVGVWSSNLYHRSGGPKHQNCFFSWCS